MNLSDLVGSSKGVPFYSAEMADGVNTIATSVSNGGYSQDRDYTAVGSAIGISSYLDTVIPLTSGSLSVSIIVDGFIYIHQRNDGGFCKYDINNNAWTLLADPPISFRHGDFVEKDGFIYWLGGYDDTNGAYVNDTPLKYDIANDSWETLSAPSGTLPNAEMFRVFNSGTEILVTATGDSELKVYSVDDNEYASKQSGLESLDGSYCYNDGYIYYNKNDSEKLKRFKVEDGTTETLAKHLSFNSNDMYHGMFVYSDIIYFTTYFNMRYIAYNIATKITQETYLGLGYSSSAYSYTVANFVYGDNMYIVNPNDAPTSNLITKTDLTKPHFYNVKV